MKYLFSISFLFIYLLGTFQPSWILVDFYWNRDDYTQKYCLSLDEGITQCRASCYFENLLKNHQKDSPESTFISSLQYKMTELIRQENTDVIYNIKQEKHQSFYNSGQYQFDFCQLIFHPPKV